MAKKNKSGPQRSRACVCGAREFHLRPRLTQASGFGFGERAIVACISCGQLTRAPSLFDGSSLVESLPGDFPPFGLFASDGGNAQHRLQSRLRKAAGLVQGNRVLDVGAGSGTFLEAARQAGWKAVGLETYPANRQVIAAKGLECLEGDVCCGAISCEPFAVVQANHVLEHLSDPLAALRNLKTMMRPGGLLVIEVPNEFARGVARFRRLFGMRKFSRTSYLEHEWFYTPRTMRQLLVRADYEVISVRTPILRGASPVRSAVIALEASLGMGPVIEAWARRTD